MPFTLINDLDLLWLQGGGTGGAVRYSVSYTRF